MKKRNESWIAKVWSKPEMQVLLWRAFRPDLYVRYLRGEIRPPPPQEVTE